MELPPTGGPGPAEPRALRRRRDPASSTRPVSRGPRRAGDGLDARAPPAPPFGTLRPSVPAGPFRGTAVPGPARNARRAGPPETQPLRSTPPQTLQPELRTLLGAGPGGGTSFGNRAGSVPESDFIGRGERRPYLGAALPISTAPFAGVSSMSPPLDLLPATVLILALPLCPVFLPPGSAKGGLRGPEVRKEGLCRCLHGAGR